MYRVKIPYGAGTRATKRGQILDDTIEQAPRFHMLLSEGFIEPFNDGGEEYADRCYVVEQSFKAEGERLAPGTFLDLRERQWRNEDALLATGMIRRATRSEAEAGAASVAPPRSETTRETPRATKRLSRKRTRMPHG